MTTDEIVARARELRPDIVWHTRKGGAGGFIRKGGEGGFVGLGGERGPHRHAVAMRKDDTATQPEIDYAITLVADHIDQAQRSAG